MSLVTHGVKSPIDHSDSLSTRWCLVRLIAEVFPDPHGPITPVTELDVACHELLKWLDRNEAKPSRCRVSSEGVSIGVSDHGGLILEYNEGGELVELFRIVVILNSTWRCHSLDRPEACELYQECWLGWSLST